MILMIYFNMEGLIKSNKNYINDVNTHSKFQKLEKWTGTIVLYPEYMNSISETEEEDNTFAWDIWKSMHTKLLNHKLIQQSKRKMMT